MISSWATILARPGLSVDESVAMPHYPTYTA